MVKHLTSRGRPCIDNDNVELSSRTYSYYDAKVPTRSSCGGRDYDYRYMIIDSQGEETFLSENGANYTGLPGYNSSSTLHQGISYKQYARPWIHWELGCESKDKLDRNEVIKRVKQIESNASILVGIITMTITYLVTAFIIGLIQIPLSVMLMLGDNPAFKQIKNITASVGGFIKILLKFIIIILLVSFRAEAQKAYDSIIYMRDTECSTFITNNAMNNIGEAVHAAYAKNAVSIAFTTVFWVIAFPPWIWACFKAISTIVKHKKIIPTS